MIDTHVPEPISTDIKYVIKRTAEKVLFESDKIRNAITKAMESVGTSNDDLAQKISHNVATKLFRGNRKLIVPTVDEIHDMVENHLMDAGLNVIAKEYILYRSKNKPDIFKKRIALKPYEYPNLV